MIKRILCLLIVIFILITCVGCGSNIATVEDIKSKEDFSSMFVIIESDHLWSEYNIVYHKETKVMYAVSCNTVFTVMVDADGEPLLYEEDLY